MKEQSAKEKGAKNGTYIDFAAVQKLVSAGLQKE
jgi:hypothetical protein